MRNPNFCPVITGLQSMRWGGGVGVGWVECGVEGWRGGAAEGCGGVGWGGVGWGGVGLLHVPGVAATPLILGSATYPDSEPEPTKTVQTVLTQVALT